MTKFIDFILFALALWLIMIAAGLVTVAVFSFAVWDLHGAKALLSEAFFFMRITGMIAIIVSAFNSIGGSHI